MHMMKKILIPAGYGEAEFTEKRSHFIGHIWQTDSEEMAQALIKETRGRHPDAAHNVYAYVVRENGISRYSDDGEPGGSSGLPTMNVLLGEGVTDALCVVTRYFGGVLLGRGGLSRAYSKAAKLALESAGISTLELYTELGIVCGYPRYEQARRIIETWGAVVESVDYGADVSMRALCLSDDVERLTAAIVELTAGSAAIETLGESFRAI